MIKKTVSFSLPQPLFLLLMAVLFVAGGFVAFKSLPIEAFPDVSDIQVAVITLFPGHAPEEVEKQVTIPLEIALSGVPHSVRLFSHTQFGLSFIVLTFDDKVDDYFARARVQERLPLADLPSGVEPGLAPLATPIGELYRYRLKGDGLTSRDLRTLEDWVVERTLKQAQGVADVVTMGGFIKQYEVHPDMGRRKGENPSTVLASVKEKIDALNTSILPRGVQIVPYYDRTWLIHTTLDTVFHNLAEGAALVTAVLFLFLGNLRAAGIVALVIPLALLSTFLGLSLRGIPANLLSLGAMDFGIIVDGAVIVVENVYRRLS